MTALDDLEGARQQLIRHLETLIAWKSCFGAKSIDLCSPMEPEQYEVQRILDANPKLAGEPEITDEIGLARQALIEKMRRWAETTALLSGDSPPNELYVPRRYSLAELLKPPL